MAERYRSERRVEFRDTDAAGIMHFSTYFTCMEEVEHEFLRSLGWSVVQRESDADEAATISWPRVAAACDYSRPSRFEDLLTLELEVAHLGTKSVKYGFTFLAGDDQPLARGSLTAVCCRIVHGKPPEAIAIPDDLRSQLMRYYSAAD